MFDLALIWYFVAITAMICYAILDGFDLGVGALHLFTKKDEERRVFLNAIGPVWDGNEVWLVIVIGGLFAGFPNVYATILSAFYNLIMILVSGLIFRAVAIEFRSQHPSPRWRKIWDTVFSVASITIAFGIGLTLGNLIEGIPLDDHGDFVGSFLEMFSPYSILLGIMSLALFTMHGAIYLVMKTEGALHKRLRRWVTRSLLFFIVSYALVTFSTLTYIPHMTDWMRQQPILFIVPVLALFAIAAIPLLIKRGYDGWGFISSCISIALFLVIFAIGTFPFLVRSTINPDTNSLLISNSASSPLTLKVLLVIVAIGLPLVFAYGFYIYRIFRGKVKLDKSSY